MRAKRNAISPSRAGTAHEEVAFETILQTHRRRTTPTIGNGLPMLEVVVNFEVEFCRHLFSPIRFKVRVGASRFASGPTMRSVEFRISVGVGLRRKVSLTQLTEIKSPISGTKSVADQV